MADVIITLKIMPEAPNVNLDYILKLAEPLISSFGGKVGKVSKEPIAFGLSSLNISFFTDEKKGGTDALEQKIAKLTGVSSVSVIDVRRAVG